MTKKQLLDQLATELPEYWAWLQSKPNALKKVQNLAQQAADSGWGFGRFSRNVQQLQSYGTFSAGVETDEDPLAEEELLEEELLEDPFATDDAWLEQQKAEAEARERENVLDLLRNFLQENELPATLLNFIQQALAQKKSYARIVAELRETPEYKIAYPEMELRQQYGWDHMTEAEIRGWRSEARRLAREYFGYDLGREELAQILGVRNKSIREYEVDLKTLKDLERWGPAVKMVLASELGYEPDDELVYRFLHAEIQTPELDRAYRRSLLRGQPAAIGLGIRPEEEATILEQYGISPEQAFRGYQEILGELPRADRYRLIEAEIGRNLERFPPASSLFAESSFSDLFKAIQLRDPDALQKLQIQFAREVARFQAGGGAVQSGSGAAVGLLTAAERAQR